MTRLPDTPPLCNDRTAGAYQIPFGKHKGLRLDQIPHSYLMWLLAEKKTGPALKQAIREFLDVDCDEDTTEPDSTSAAVAMPLVVWLWGEQMGSRYSPLDDKALAVIADGVAVLKKICTMYTHKDWLEGGAA